LPASGALAGFFLLVDTAFLSANVAKIVDGGYIPLLLAACVYGLMLTWHRGVTAISQGLHDRLMPVGRFVAQVE
ncbi:KUP/HAK/KT family potassium transporter, partial [Stenotrophomonas maltophilia]|uniref:KUP/HAK/KT family potassium transporter n=1 Tax=Stenotrophomonas maltophilia TaxID=40324 RepID=UPI001953CCA8